MVFIDAKLAEGNQRLGKVLPKSVWYLNSVAYLLMAVTAAEPAETVLPSTAV